MGGAQQLERGAEGYLVLFHVLAQASAEGFFPSALLRMGETLLLLKHSEFVRQKCTK